MVSIIVLVYNRPELTKQTLDSMWHTLKPTTYPYELIIVDNGSDEATKELLHTNYDGFHLITRNQNTGIGAGKNAGVEAALYDNIYISDNDLYYQPEWLDTIIKTSEIFPKAAVIGAFRHDYHGVITVHEEKGYSFEQSDQQVGSSWYLSKANWHRFGPLMENVSYGIDDVAFCNKVNEAGLWVGSILPHKAIHCGMTNSHGESTPGSHLMMGKHLAKNILIK